MKYTHSSSHFLITFILSGVILGTSSGFARKKAPQNGVERVTMNGYIEQRIQSVIEKRVKGQDVKEIVDVFKQQNELHEMWGMEFWGKWVQGAIGCYQYTKDAALLEIIRGSVAKMLSYQLSDGYIGNYDREHQLKGWDVWGRKYVALGLLKWYMLTGDKRALEATSRLIDYTIDQTQKVGKRLCECGNYKGMAPGSILEPVMFLYNFTKSQKYLDFAQWIVSDIEQEGGAQLISHADIPVYNRWPVGFDKWWTKDNGQKAYEMMSCYVGLLELGKVTGEDYLSVVKKVVKHIEDEEINICGSGSANECWYRGYERQTTPAFHMMETCVTFTWMQINERLLQMTGDSHYADNIERTFYNALLASTMQDGSQIAKYTPLEGVRHEGEHQCGLHINCCNANGPRGYAMIPRLAYRMGADNQLFIDIYGESHAALVLQNIPVQIKQQTDYPKDGNITLEINPTKPVAFSLALRIPAWSKKSSVMVNGEAQTVVAGNYCTIQRTWKPGDKVQIQLDMRTKVQELNHCVALLRGPIVLARDTRFGDGFVDECVEFKPDAEGYVDVKPCAVVDGMWMGFELTGRSGVHKEGIGYKNIHFCDFASAGSSWKESDRYRVWLTQTINVLKEPR